MSEYKLPAKYRIAEVSISEDGKEIWIGYYGDHADQGGFTFRWGEFGLGSVDDAMEILKQRLNENLSKIRDVLEKRDSEE